MIRLVPPLSTGALGDGTALDLPRTLGCHALLLHTTSLGCRRISSARPYSRRRGRPRRHDRGRRSQRVQQNLSFVIKPLHSASRKRKRSWGWTTMKSGSIRAGITICSRVCWPISFCGISRAGWKKKAPALTVSQVRRLLEVVLPLKVLQADEVLQLVAEMQQRQHRAYLSHRKRRLHEIFLK